MTCRKIGRLGMDPITWRPWFSLSFLKLLIFYCPWSVILFWFRVFLNLRLVMWRPVSFPCHFYSLLILLGWNYNQIHIWCRCIYFLYLMRWGSVRIDLNNFSSFVVLGSKVVQNTTFFLLLYYRSVSGGFSLVGCSPCLLMCKCPIAVFLGFLRYFLMRFSVGLDKSSGNLSWFPWG